MSSSSAAVIWLTHAEAKIFQMGAGGIAPEKLEIQGRGHNRAHDSHKEHDTEKFFHEVAGKLEGMKEILIVGPGTAKQEFRHHLEKHHHAKLSQAVVGVETADHPTEPQILALARKFFKTYDLYSGT